MPPKAKAKGGAKARARSKSLPKARAKAAAAAPAAAAAAAPVAAPPPPPPEPHVPVEGKTKVRYNHYNQDFPLLDHKLKWDVVDEEYCISFVFKGNFTTKVVAPDGTELRQVNGEFSDLEHDSQYTLVVEEDPELANAPRKAYVAASSSNDFIKRGGGGEMGEDSASCSCLYGNPCQSAYSCKDWNNRFEVATRNGWKGFG